MGQRQDNQKRYRVRACYDVRDAGQTYGDFNDRDAAEDCVVALATRPDVRSATIEEVE